MEGNGWLTAALMRKRELLPFGCFPACLVCGVEQKGFSTPRRDLIDLWAGNVAQEIVWL